MSYNKTSLILDYFSPHKISNRSAYWLGFIQTDGCIYYIVINNYPAKYLVICLAPLDEEHLHKFKKDIEYTGKIRHYKDKNVSISIGHKDFVEYIEQWGITPRKTFTTKLIQMPDEFYSHYIRGLVDGDGSVYYRQNSYPVINISSASMKFLEQLQEVIFRLINIRGYINKMSGKNAWRLIWNKQDSHTLASYVYKDKQDLYLERKYNKFYSLI